jgi:hypothetical protein
MIGKIRSRLSSAHLVAVVALVFAIGGGSALALVGKNTVFSDDIKNGQVKKPDIRKGAVTKAKLAANAVNSAKVVDNSLKGADIGEGTLSCAGIPNADCSADDAVEPTAGGAVVASPAAVVSTQLTSNGSFSFTRGSFTLETSATSGNCNNWDLVGPAGQEYSGEDYDFFGDFQNEEGVTPDINEADNLSFLNVVLDSGGGGATFQYMNEDDGANLCNVIISGVG